MNWYIVYKGKPHQGSLAQNLSQEGIPYYLPTQKVQVLQQEEMVEVEKPVFQNLIFIQTDADIYQLTQQIDGLRFPYIDQAHHRPAQVSDAELSRFRQVLALKEVQARFLSDAYVKFSSHPKVRVIAGPFQGMEGYVVRMRRDRKLVISLGTMAVAISGIHFSLLETIN